MNKKIISLILLGLLVVSLISYVIADELLQEEPVPSEQVELAIEEAQEIQQQIEVIREEEISKEREIEREITIERQKAESRRLQNQEVYLRVGLSE
jgi:hypothetical protein